jgi:hypothetical protein
MPGLGKSGTSRMVRRMLSRMSGAMPCDHGGDAGMRKRHAPA